MQSRVVAIKSCTTSWFGPLSTWSKQVHHWPQLCLSSATNATADASVHSQDSQGEAAEDATKAAIAEQDDSTKSKQTSQPLKSHLTSRSKLENSSVKSPIDPHNQQRRQCHSSPTVRAIEEVNCFGLAGDDLSEEDDNQKYYKDHRPSPISEIRIADTRISMRRATDNELGNSGEVIRWRPEQLDTAEDSLLRAEALFRASKERGDPDSPQASVLRKFGKIV